MHVYMYVYVHVYVCICVRIYIYICSDMYIIDHDTKGWCTYKAYRVYVVYRYSGLNVNENMSIYM